MRSKPRIVGMAPKNSKTDLTLKETQTWWRDAWGCPSYSPQEIPKNSHFLGCPSYKCSNVNSFHPRKSQTGPTRDDTGRWRNCLVQTSSQRQSGARPIRPAGVMWKAGTLGVLLMRLAATGWHGGQRGLRVWPGFVWKWCIYVYLYIYIWVNYNDLTATSLEIMVSKGHHPQNGRTIQVSEILYNLPRYIYIYILYIFIYM